MKHKKLAMNNVQKSGLFLALLISSLVVLGCNDPFEPAKTGYGRISISFTEDAASAEARTTFPSVPVFDTYVYTFTKEGESEGMIMEPDHGGFFVLEVGSYTVEVQAFFGNAETHTLAASGKSAPFRVSSAGTGSVLVPLAIVNAAETIGILSYTITWPEGAEGEIILQRWPEMTAVTLNPSNISTTGKTQTLALSVGSYLFSITVNKNDLFTGKIEVVYIYPSLTTVYEKSFSTADLLSAEPIANAEINIPAPANGTAPSTTAHGTGNFTLGTVSWSPSHNPFLGSTVYVATVTLTANSRHTFTGLNSATINGQNATVSNNTGKTVTLSYTFPATDSRIVTAMTIKTQPTILSYTHGDPLNLAGLVVTLTHDDTTTEDIAAAEFADKNIMAVPSQGNHLVHVSHNGQPVAVTFGNITRYTDNLTVKKAPGTFPPHAALDVVYAPSLSLNNLVPLLGNNYAWVTPSALLAVGEGQFAAVYTDPSGNYEPAEGFITVNVAKAAGAAVGAPTLDNVTSTTITIHPVNSPANGQMVEYAISATGAVPATGWQNGTTFTGLSSFTRYYIFARSVENNYYTAGAASSGLSVTTMKIGSLNRIEYYWVNQHDSLVTTSSGRTSVAPGAILTITAQSAGYTVRQWYVDGVTTGQNAITHNFISVVPGQHTVGLFVEKDGKLYNTNITINVASTISVTYDRNGGTGTVPAVQTISPGNSVTLPTYGGLTRTGYIRDGWNTMADGTGDNYSTGTIYTPPDNITLYAKWVLRTVFDLNTGNGATPDEQIVLPGSSIILPDDTEIFKPGYTLGGWDTGPLGNGTIYPAGSVYIPVASGTLYAVWTSVVTFDANGGTGTVPDTRAVIFGRTTALPNAVLDLVREGYVFGGWNILANGTGDNYAAGFSYAPAGNITLYARWNPRITIEMYDAGGDGWGNNSLTDYGFLRIHVFGANGQLIRMIASIAVSNFAATETFTAAPGEYIEVYWMVGNMASDLFGVAGRKQEENSFIMYYNAKPPSPAFYTGPIDSAGNVGPTSWNGSNALIYKTRGSMTNTLSWDVLLAFTVQSE